MTKVHDITKELLNQHGFNTVESVLKMKYSTLKEMGVDCAEFERKERIRMGCAECAKSCMACMAHYHDFMICRDEYCGLCWAFNIARRVFNLNDDQIYELSGL